MYLDHCNSFWYICLTFSLLLQEYPDYYEVIKKPIDLEKIGQKVKASHYENLEELLADIVLMFDNACRYNEPDSQIYKVIQ